MFQYRETKCSYVLERSVFAYWNEVFSLLKQTVQLRETDCFVKGNRLLYTLKHPLLK
ncbi:hypothetical protein M094_0442 [Bacteroides uniformis str. 3978 T3 ii]|uniref:Uncharacterized protein n=1 Tax=Bacteroides uniformis str. 3978 T3 ii TaxID=1339349 RepID=A0A078S1R1_BACUN|nr:hypothetical protein M094_0442 [Bacteroides uniformis str. 3978 T3 ii]